MPTIGRTSDSVVVNPTVDRYTATAAQTAFTLTNTPSSQVLVWVNGVLQEPTTHYTLSGRTLTLGTACTVGDKVAVEYGTNQTGLVRDRRWTPGSIHPQNDEFSDAVLAPAWTALDVSGGAARRTWTEDADSLSLSLTGSDAASELHAMMRPYALAVGESVQVHMKWGGPGSNYPFAGIVVGDGATYGSGSQIIAIYFPTLAIINQATWTGYNTRVLSVEYGSSYWGNEFHLRLTRSATSTWQIRHSCDGVSWYKMASDQTLSITPSHIGVAGGTFGGGSPFAFSFDYLRVIA